MAMWPYSVCMTLLPASISRSPQHPVTGLEYGTSPIPLEKPPYTPIMTSRQALLNELTHFTNELHALYAVRDQLLLDITTCSSHIYRGLAPQTTHPAMSWSVIHLRMRCISLKLTLVAAWLGPSSILVRASLLPDTLPIKFFGDYRMLKLYIGKLERECYKMQMRFEKAYGVKDGFVGDAGERLLWQEPYVHAFVPGEFPNPPRTRLPTLDTK